MPKIIKSKKHGEICLLKVKPFISSPYFDSSINISSSVESSTLLTHTSPVLKLCEKFYNQDCIELAKGLLGQLIVHQINGLRLSGFIVETECYLGNNDAASHSYQGKRTPRNEPMFMKPGTSYVYAIYGMYHCFNISSGGEGSCVLIRAIEPSENLELMYELRQAKRVLKKKLSNRDLGNGPSKLCQSLKLTKEHCNKLDMTTSDSLWLEKGMNIEQQKIVTTKRIGIESSGSEWANKPLRFYILGNPYVSVRDKKAELFFQKQCTTQGIDQT